MPLLVFRCTSYEPVPRHFLLIVYLETWLMPATLLQLILSCARPTSDLDKHSDSLIDVELIYKIFRSVKTHLHMSSIVTEHVP